MQDNLGDEIKNILKKRATTKKKQSGTTLIIMKKKKKKKKKKQLKKYEKKERKVCDITFALMRKNWLEKMIKKKDGQTFTNFR